MFKKIRLRTKLLGGFAFAFILLSSVIGIYHYTIRSAINGFSRLTNVELELVNHASEIKDLMLICRRYEKIFLIRPDKAFLQILDKNIRTLITNAESIRKIAGRAGYQEEYSKTSEIMELAKGYMKSFTKVVTAYETRGFDSKSGLQGEFNNTVQVLAEKMKEHQVDDLYLAFLRMWIAEREYKLIRYADAKENLNESIRMYQNTLSQSTCSPKTRKEQEDQLKLYTDAFGHIEDDEYYYNIMKTAREQIEISLKQVYVPIAGELVLTIRKKEKDYLLTKDEVYVKSTHEAIEHLTEHFSESGLLKDHIGEVLKLVKVYQSAFDKLVGEDRKIAALETEMQKAADTIEVKVDSIQNAVMTMSKSQIANTSANARTNSKTAILIGIALIFVGGLISLLIARCITQPIHQVISGLSEASEIVSSASFEISNTSQMLAEQASTQASSVQGTSGSLKKIASISRKSLDFTAVANQLMNENIGKSEQALKTIAELTDYMTQIESDSGRISRIIQTIDGIAFQTNLLSLNAAIESARAGEAGAGFSVVAGEVKNLALRTSDAAKDTQELLQNIVQQVHHAASSLKHINTDFANIVESATIIGEKSDAITEASKTQTAEIEEISSVANSMENMTQDVAATAEESAAASEMLSAQAIKMKEYVDTLMSIAG